jgi:hypothetical protein
MNTNDNSNGTNDNNNNNSYTSDDNDIATVNAKKLARSIKNCWSVLNKKHHIAGADALELAKEYLRHPIPQVSCNKRKLQVAEIDFDAGLAKRINCSNKDLKYLYMRVILAGTNDFHNALDYANEEAIVTPYKSFPIFKQVEIGHGLVVPLCGLHTCSQLVGRQLSIVDMSAAIDKSYEQCRLSGFDDNPDFWHHLPGVKDWGSLTKKTMENLVKDDHIRIGAPTTMTIDDAVKVLTDYIVLFGIGYAYLECYVVGRLVRALMTPSYCCTVMLRAVVETAIIASARPCTRRASEREF